MSELGSLTFEGQQKEATAKGCKIVLPEVNELLVDIDNDADFDVFEKNIIILGRHYPVIDYAVRPSKSGGVRKHITVQMAAPVTPQQRIAFQAFLGSDRVRELLSWVRVDKALSAHPTVFFEVDPDAPQNQPPKTFDEEIAF